MLGRLACAQQGANWRGHAEVAQAGRFCVVGSQFVVAPCRSPVYTAGATCEFGAMQELVRTNDAVLISFIEALMRDAGIAHLVADQNMSVLDGSLGILPRRILVDEDEIERARRILADAGIANEIKTR